VAEITPQNDVVIQSEKLAPQLKAWRRELHMQPELSFQEQKTSRFIKEKLEKIPGMLVQTGIGYPTAVVGTLTNGAGPVIAIRADMDALPIVEKNDVNYRSQKAGVMHACGHDAHTAIALGASVLLGDMIRKGEIQGTVKFIFQPGEERAEENGSTGAPYMVRAGVLKEVEAVIALHMSPENPVGEVKIHDGYSMANVDVFSAEIFGSGGHGAYPHLGTDPIWMLGPVLQALYTITARKISPLEAGTVSVGKINSGIASNVIPSEVCLQGTIRSYHPKVRQVIHNELDQALAITRSLGGDYRLTIRTEDPALYNNPAVNQLIRCACQELYPDFKIVNAPFGLGGEDFAHMTKAVPGAMFFLGCGLTDEKDRNLHSAHFDIDEQVLPIGSSILAESAKRFLVTK
jgi:amidohydrolase